MTRTQLTIIAVLVVLISLFSYSVWKSGEQDRKANEFVQKIHSHIRPGASRAEIEEYLQQIGAYATFDPPGTRSNLGVERATLFDVRRVGNKREDLRMEFFFSADDVLQYYFVRPEMVGPDSPRRPPEPEPSWVHPPESPAEGQGEASTDAGEMGSPTSEQTPSEDPAAEPQQEESPSHPGEGNAQD